MDDRIVGPLSGVSVIKTSDLKTMFPETRFFYITSPNPGDMIKPLYQMGYTGWKSCGEVLEGFDPSKHTFRSINGSNQDSKYSTEHVKYLIRTCLHHHDNYLHPERLTVQSVDLIVTERCSLKCKDCSNLMQYYESPENADLNETLQSIEDLCSKMDEIYEFRVIGGEPFMNKEVHLIVEKLNSMENVHKVSIFTNATIVPKEHQWKAFENGKVRFFITEYLQSRNLQPLIEQLERRKIAYVSEKANGWTECGALEKHNRTEEEQKKVFDACCAKNLATLADGRLYRCPFSANAFKLHAVPDYAEDYLLVSNTSRDSIRAFLRGRSYISSCDHCNGRSYGDKVIEAGIQTKTPLKYKRYELKVA
jgi:hypothetical protein